MRKIIPLLIVLAGCRQVPMLPGLSAHKIDIQQGNYVTQDMVAKLKPGMTKSQVRFALGTPLIVDPFHTDRWDYIYVLEKRGRIVEQRRIVAVFEGEKLMRIEGDVVPAAASTTPAEASAQKPTVSGSTSPADTPAEGASSAPPATGASADPSSNVPKASP